MPSVAERRKVLDGRAEVISYTRDPQAFLLRVWRKESRSYWTRKIEGVCDVESACLKALDVFLEYGASSTSKKSPKRNINEQPRTKQGNIREWVDKYLNDQKEQVEAGLIKHGTYKNKSETYLLHLIPYLENKNIKNTKEIKVGVFDKYPVYRAGVSRHTLRRELGAIKMLLTYFHRHRLLDPYEFTDQLIPKVKLEDEDWDSNPPIRDEQEWRTILKHLHRFVKDGDANPKAKVRMNRHRFWCFLLVLKNSGLRPAEALALRWSDIEVENIYRKTSRGGDVDRFVVHIRVLASKTKSLREVTANCAQPLARWRKHVREYLDKHESHFRWNGVVLKRSEQDGLPIIPNDAPIFGIPEKSEWKVGDYSTFVFHWRTVLDMARNEIRGPLISPHQYTIYSMRSSRAQELFEMGVDPMLAARQMGHSVDMMSRIYARMPSRKRAIKEAAALPFGQTRRAEEIVSLDEVY